MARSTTISGASVRSARGDLLVEQRRGGQVELSLDGQVQAGVVTGDVDLVDPNPL
ncbi:MAG: hypothetical protein ACR2OB_12005 [Solirubrobacteraceae bacterium]